MTLNEAHAALKAQFHYTSDTIKGDPTDYWKLWPKTAEVYDDCDGFSLNLVLRYFGSFWKPIFTRKAVLYHCNYYGEGHMVVKIGDYWCDNIQTEPFYRIPPGYADFKPYNRFMVVMNMFCFKSEWRARVSVALGLE